MEQIPATYAPKPKYAACPSVTTPAYPSTRSSDIANRIQIMIVVPSSDIRRP